MTAERGAFYDPRDIAREVESRLREAERRGARVDYITFVPDGEPTLDSNLGKEIELLKGLGKPVAVLTNASLLWREDVRAELAEADYVLVNVDTAGERLWRIVNRPHGSLSIEAVPKGWRRSREISAERWSRRPCWWTKSSTGMSSRGWRAS